MGSKRPMQNLILEILHAQPSLRDSKSYLNSFAPRPAGDKHKNQPQRATPPFPFKSSAAQSDPSSSSHLPQHGPPPPSPQIALKSASLFAQQRSARQAKKEFASSPSSAEAEVEEKEVDKDALDSHHFAESDTTSVSTSTSIRERDDAGKDARTAQETLNDTLPASPVQQHIALVKVQGPFTSRQLESIADGMVYLKRLGLVSVIVVDSEEATWKSAISTFSPTDGRRIESDIDLETEDLAPWMALHNQTGGSSSSKVGKQQEVLRKRMLTDVVKLSDLLTQKGAPARPFSHAVLRVDADRVAQIDEVYPPSLTGRACAHHYDWAVEAPSMDRSPLVSDDALTSIRKALESDMIPVIAPLALYDDPDGGQAPRTVCVSANDTLVGLAREMSAHGKHHAFNFPDQFAGDPVDLMPLRLMVINREGGIPSHARGGNPHLSINLASEFYHVASSFIWDESHPTALDNLSMVRDCLAFMPQTSSGVVVSHRSPKSLIANLITNKAAHSPSLPHRLLAGRQDVRHTPTIVRPGLDIRVIQNFDGVDWHKMTSLLQASFKRELNVEAYLERLRKSLDFVIVTGDYEGAAIVTHEYAPGEDPSTHESIAYLDKFAVLPSLQGSGAVDFLWGALRDEVHGLGLLDALNDNGGKGGFGKGKDLVWKSRSNNPVNRWYYERSNGFIKIHTDAAASSQGNPAAWAMFWCDAEEKVATMAGERRLAAEATRDEILAAAREKLADKDVQRALLSEEDDEDDGAGRQTSSYRSYQRRQRTDSGKNSQTEPRRDLSQLHSGDNSQRLLPVIAPDEQGRLQRWAKCMSTIPSAWL